MSFFFLNSFSYVLFWIYTLNAYGAQRMQRISQFFFRFSFRNISTAYTHIQTRHYCISWVCYRKALFRILLIGISFLKDFNKIQKITRNVRLSAWQQRHAVLCVCVCVQAY